MSELGQVSGQLAREQQVLHAISRAVLALQSEALGVREAMGLEPEAVQHGRDVLLPFLERLRSAIGGDTSDPTLGQLATFSMGGRPKDDWLEDLKMTRNALVSGAPLAGTTLAPLVAIVGALDREFAETLNRLYGRQ